MDTWRDSATCKNGNFYLRWGAFEKNLTRILPALQAVYLQKHVIIPAPTQQAPDADYTRNHVIKHESASEFTRGVISDCLQLQVFLSAIVGCFACDFAGSFTCNSSVFACKLHVFLPVNAGNFAS